MQHRLPIYTENPPAEPTDPVSVIPCDATKETELARLEREIARMQSRIMRQERKRSRIGERIRRLRNVQRSLAMQLESLRRSDYAVIRYRSRLSTSVVSILWYDRPTSDLELERLRGLGVSRLRAIYDVCPTIGDMEVTRVHEGLTKIPGLRQAMVARIEKRLFAWLARHAVDYEPMPSAECRAKARAATMMPRKIE